MFRLTPAVRSVLIVNALCLVLSSFSLFRADFVDLFGLRVALSSRFHIYQFFSYMWFHAGFWHLFSNMFAILVFAPPLEQLWGTKRFMNFYLLCGMGAAMLYGVANFAEKYPIHKDAESFRENPDPELFRIFISKHVESKAQAYGLIPFSDAYYDNPTDLEYIHQARSYVDQLYSREVDVPMIGASGAVFAILLAFGMLYPNTYLYLFFAIPVKAKYVVMGYALFEIYAEFERTPGDQVAHLAHLGGMVFAFFILKYWYKDRVYP